MAGKFVLNGIPYLGGESNVKEVTRSQYEALPASKLSDGILYAIKDDMPDSIRSYPPLIYSDQEREIGVWRDGRPLYQKTFEIAPSSSAYEVLINHGISDLRECVKYEGHMYQNSYAYGRFLPQLYRSEVAGYSASVYTITNQAASVVYGDWVKDNAANLTISVTFFYTKTTDTPGSGIWTSQGAIAQHYSTDEHIIGTWIDGKPLYERTLVFQNASASSSSDYSIDISTQINNIESCIKFEALFVETDKITIMPVALNGNYKNYSFSVSHQGGTSFLFTRGAGQITGDIILTVQYTKTTD